MKIAMVNNSPHHDGLGVYAFELRKALEDSCSVMADHIYVSREDRSLYLIDRQGKTCVKHMDPGVLNDNGLFRLLHPNSPNLILDFMLGRYMPDVYDLYHLTNQHMCNLLYHSVFKDAKKIITVHDIFPYISGGHFQKPLMRALYAGINRADMLIAISDFTKQELVRYFNISRNKIVVIYHGIRDVFKPIEETDLIQTRKKYNLDAGVRYLLHVGRPDPRKNVISLIKALHDLTGRHGMSDIKFIKVGGFTREEQCAIMEFNLNHCVQLIDSISSPLEDIDLADLYNIAELFVYPSTYEGLGAPPLEAMACGTPVIASNIPPLTETIVDCGKLVDPLDSSTLAKAIYDVLMDKSYGEELSQKGLSRAQSFTWEKTAKETLALYCGV